MWLCFLLKGSVKEDNSFSPWMNCAFVICNSDFINPQSRNNLVIWGSDCNVSTVPDIICKAAVWAVWTQYSWLKDPLPNYQVTLTLEWGMIYEGHYTLSVHNSNKNPGHSRMITIISIVRLFGGKERILHLWFSSSFFSGLVVVNNSQYLY